MSNTEKANTDAAPEELPEPAKPVKRDYLLEAAIESTYAEIARRSLEEWTPQQGPRPHWSGAE